MIMDTHQLKQLKNKVIGDVEQKKRLSSNKENLNMLIDQISPTRLHNQTDIDKLVQSTLILGSLFTGRHNDINNKALFGVIQRLIETATACTCQRVLEYLFRCLRNAALYYNQVGSLSSNGRNGIESDAMNIDDEDINCKATTELNVIFLVGYEFKF